MRFNIILFTTKAIFRPSFYINRIFMKNTLLICFLFVSSVTFAQDKTCTLWLGELSESTNNIKQFAEKTLKLQTKILPAEANNIQEMRDENDLAQIKVWLKPKKMLMNGAMSTVYTISSYKIVSLSENIDELYKKLGAEVQQCITESTPLNTLFGTNRMYIERQSGGFGKKGLPMSTLTIIAKLLSCCGMLSVINSGISSNMIRERTDVC